MSSFQHENLKSNLNSTVKQGNHNIEIGLKNSSYKKRKNKTNSQQQTLELKNPSSKNSNAPKKSLAGDRFIPLRGTDDNSDFQNLLLINKKKDTFGIIEDHLFSSNVSGNNLNNTNSINNTNNPNNTDNQRNREKKDWKNNSRYEKIMMESLMINSNYNLNKIKSSNNDSQDIDSNGHFTENDLRILNFTNKNKISSTKSSTSNFINDLKKLGEKNDFLIKNNKDFSERIISNTPERILDAPNLADDYYLNLLDWSSNNIIAVGLGENVYVWNGYTSESNLLMAGHDNICSVSWMTLSANCLAIGMRDGTTQLWDAQKMIELRKLNGHSNRISSLSWNNNILSTGSKDSKIINHDIRMPNHIIHTLIGHTHEVCKLKWSPNGNYLASGGNDNLLCIWDVTQTNSASNTNRNFNNFSNTNNFRNPSDSYASLFNNSNILENNRISINNTNIINNNLLGASDFNGHNISANNPQSTYISNSIIFSNNNQNEAHNNNIRNLNLLNSPSVSTNLNNNIESRTRNSHLLIQNPNIIWSINERNSLSEFTNSNNSFSPLNNGQNANQINPKFISSAHEAAVKALDWCPWQKNVLVSGAGSRDKTIKFWNVENMNMLNSVNTESQVCNAIFNPNEKELISSHGYAFNQICFWKYPSMSKFMELNGHLNRVLYLAMSPDASTIVSGAGDETLRFWKISDNKKNMNLNTDLSLSSINLMNYQVR